MSRVVIHDGARRAEAETVLTCAVMPVLSDRRLMRGAMRTRKIVWALSLVVGAVPAGAEPEGWKLHVERDPLTKEQFSFVRAWGEQISAEANPTSIHGYDAKHLNIALVVMCGADVRQAVHMQSSLPLRSHSLELTNEVFYDFDARDIRSVGEYQWEYYRYMEHMFYGPKSRRGVWRRVDDEGFLWQLEDHRGEFISESHRISLATAIWPGLGVRVYMEGSLLFFGYGLTDGSNILFGSTSYRWKLAGFAEAWAECPEE